MLRETHKLTQEELGRQIGITRRVISTWERGRPIPADEVPKIARVFDVTICGLYGQPEHYGARAQPTVADLVERDLSEQIPYLSKADQDLLRAIEHWIQARRAQLRAEEGVSSGNPAEPLTN
jgi:transcriptional regulator with XRE-family HTH domain